MNNVRLCFKKLKDNAIIPSYAHEGDSGMDIRSLISCTIPPKWYACIDTGIAADIPDGYEIQVRPRSGLAFNNGVVCALGTVDSNYTGQIRVVLFNLGMFDFRVSEGDRVAQLVLAPVSRADICEVSEIVKYTQRGTQGFGSTGVR